MNESMMIKDIREKMEKTRTKGTTTRIPVGLDHMTNLADALSQ